MRISTMTILRFATYILACSIPVMAYASDAIPSPNVVKEHPAFFSWFLGVVLLVALYLVAKMIKAAEQNNDLQWQAIHAMDRSQKKMHEELIALKTEHKFHHNQGRDE